MSSFAHLLYFSSSSQSSIYKIFCFILPRCFNNGILNKGILQEKLIRTPVGYCKEEINQSFPYKNIQIWNQKKQIIVELS
jgi:hypothetical protein